MDADKTDIYINIVRLKDYILPDKFQQMCLKSFLCTLAFICVSLSSQAQELRVVKDNISCAYGLKNELGEWVVSAQYQYIQAVELGYYLIYDGENLGVLNRVGKLIIPAKYQEISPLFHQAKIVKQLPRPRIDAKPSSILFKIRKASNYGIFNENGKQVFPFKYETITVDGSSNAVLHRKKRNAYYSTYIDASGEVLIDIKGYLNLFRQKHFALVSDFRHQSSEYHWNAGIITKDGSWLIPRGHERIHINYRISYNHPEQLVVKDGNKTLLLDAHAKPVSAPRYRVHTGTSYGNGDAVWLQPKQLYVVSDSLSKYGLMRGDEQVVLEPQFRWIEEHSAGYHFSDYYCWMAYTHNGKMGVLSPTGDLSIKPIYDTLIPIAVVRGDDRQRAGQRYHFIMRKAGKYGLLTEEGVVLEPAQNEAFFVGYRASGVHYYFTGKDGIRAYNTEVFPASKSPLKFVAQHDSLLLYRSPNGLIPFVSKSVESGLADAKKSAQLTFKTYGELFTVFHPERAFLFYESTGKVWYDNKITGLYGGHGRDLIITDANGLKGTVDEHTGKMLIPPKYYDFKNNYSTGDKVWADLENPKTTSTYYCGKWQILTKQGEVVSPILFDKPFHLHGVTYPSSNFLKGMFNTTTLSWIVPPAFCGIYKLPSGQIEVIGMNGKIGLLDANGQWLADTIYDDLAAVYQGVSLHRKPIIGEKDYIDTWYALTKDSTTVLIDQDGAMLYDRSTIDSIKTTNAFYSFDTLSTLEKKMEPYRIRGKLLTLNNKNSRCYQCFNVQVKSWAWNALQNALIKSQIYETMQSKSYGYSYDHSIPIKPSLNKVDCTFCPQNLNTTRGLVHNGLTLDFVNDFSFSFQRYEANHRTDPLGMPVMSSDLLQHTYNFMLQNGSWEELSIQDVFGDDDVLLVEYTLALSKRDDLDLDCSNFDNVNALLENKWTFSQEGIWIYVGQALQGQEELQPKVLIPWENLSKYKETSTIAKRFLRFNL